MPDLLLHIGHIKTGSTWLQAGFRENVERLAKLGIRYPRVGGEAKRIDYDRMIPTGNGGVLLEDRRKFARRLAKAVPDAAETTLFSSELLFNRLAGQRSVGDVVAAARAHGFERVRLLLFTRAPMPLAVSVWQQVVKGWEGETRDLDTFVTERFDLPRRVADFADQVAATDGAELTLHNYDTHREDLLAPVEAWLGLDQGTLARPQSQRLNRSLTRSEAALQVALNRAMGPSEEVFALRLTSRLPDVPAEPPQISSVTAEAAIARLSPALDRLDELLPEGQVLSRAIPETRTVDPITFNEAQLAVIAEGIAAYLRPSPRALARRIANGIRHRLRERRRRRRARSPISR